MSATGSLYFQLSFNSVVRGFHVYQAVWTPVLNAEYSTNQEHGNAEDQYAVAVTNNDQVVILLKEKAKSSAKSLVEDKGLNFCKVGWKFLVFTH